jgi:hypothetical protein
VSDVRSYFGDQEAENYERLFGERDREATRKLRVLLRLPASLFTVGELASLFAINAIKGEMWKTDDVAEVSAIYDRWEQAEKRGMRLL